MARGGNIYAPSEAEIQAAVMEHWQAFGVPGSLVAACPNARAFGQAGLTRGLFDLIVMSPTLGDRTGWLELKADRCRRLSEDQLDIQVMMIRLGIPHAVVYGRDEPIRQLERWGALKRQSEPRILPREATLKQAATA
jgi:hypothetical protein